MVPEENRQYRGVPSLMDLTLDSSDTRPDPSTQWLGDFLKREGLNVEPVPPASLIEKDRGDGNRDWPQPYYNGRRKIWMIAAFVVAVPAIGLPLVLGLQATAPAGPSSRRLSAQASYLPPAASPGPSAPDAPNAAPISRDVPIFPLPLAQAPPEASASDEFADLPPPGAANDPPAPVPTPPAATEVPPEPGGSAPAAGPATAVSPPPAAPAPSIANVPPAPAAGPKTNETASNTPPPSVPEAASPPVPVASAASALPSGTPLRLSIAYDPARPETQMAAGELGKALQRALGDVAATDVVPTRTPASKVVYFFANDRDAAIRVADSLGRLTDDHAPVEMLHQKSPPPPGTVQILLPPTKEVER